MKPFQAKFPAIDKIGLSLEEELERQGDLSHLPLLFGVDKWRQGYDDDGADESALWKLDSLSPSTPGLITCICPLKLNKKLELLFVALPKALSNNGGRMVIVGSGPFREGLEVLLEALDCGDGETLELIAKMGGRLAGEMEKPFFEMTRYLQELKENLLFDEWLDRCASMDLFERLRFVGDLPSDVIRDLCECSSLVLREEDLQGKTVDQMAQFIEKAI